MLASIKVMAWGKIHAPVLYTDKKNIAIRGTKSSDKLTCVVSGVNVMFII